MKNILKVLPLFTVVAVPALLVLETAGVGLPSSLSLQGALHVCVASLVSLIAVSDYARAGQPRAVPARAATKAAHPLAA